jgi:hypothetical protein
LTRVLDPEKEKKMLLKKTLLKKTLLTLLTLLKKTLLTLLMLLKKTLLTLLMLLKKTHAPFKNFFSSSHESLYTRPCKGCWYNKTVYLRVKE